MDAALLLLALLGHAALWVGLVNRLHARSPAPLVADTGHVPAFLALPLVPAGLGWWCFRAEPAMLDRLRAGAFLRSAPWGVRSTWCCATAAARIAVVGWLWLHVLHRPPAVSRFHGIRSLLTATPRRPRRPSTPIISSSACRATRACTWT